MTTVNINNGGGDNVDVGGAINSGARTSPPAASPHAAATHARRLCAADAPPAIHREILLVGRGYRPRQPEGPKEPQRYAEVQGRLLLLQGLFQVRCERRPSHSQPAPPPPALAACTTARPPRQPCAALGAPPRPSRARRAPTLPLPPPPLCAAHLHGQQCGLGSQHRVCWGRHADRSLPHQPLAAVALAAAAAALLLAHVRYTAP